MFAGDAGLTKAVSQIGGPKIRVRTPHDARYGQDITQDDEFLQMMEAEAPRWRHMAPPCRTFTKARCTDEHGTVKALRSKERPEGFGDDQTVEANTITDRCVSLAEKQLDEGKWFSMENPEPSLIWELKSVRSLRKRPEVRFVGFDQCAYGGPFKKSTGEGRVWSYKTEQEVWLTAEAAEYPTGMCEAWAKGWIDWLRD